MKHEINATVTEMNAYKYSDNYTVQTVSEPVNVAGCEHNETEAVALAKYLQSSKGIKYEVVKNARHIVQAAKTFRPQPLRCDLRDEAFKIMRIY